MSKIFDEPVGLLREATIVSYDETKKTIKVQLDNSPVSKGNSTLIDIQAPFSLTFNNGLFVGTNPTKNTKIVIGQGSGNQYYYVSSLSKDLSKVPEVKKDNLLIQSNDLTKISLDTKSNIIIGSDSKNISINSLDFYSNTIDNQYSFSQASMTIDGIVKRENKYKTNIADELKLKDNKYYLSNKSIGLDFNISSNNLTETSSKNPPFIENRKLIYEFQESSKVENNLYESTLYDNKKVQNDYSYPDRRKLRSNVLNLSQNNPNYLIEKISGTVVDIFGNVLDINRFPINLLGKSLNDQTINNKSEIFNDIKKIHKKGIAHHFEINTKKDEVPDISITDNYSRDRSRFYFDVDKEGQFKLNVPSSSEHGNIPLLTRYENYSHVSDEDNNNPNKLIFRDDNLDIVHDSFNVGVISIKSDGAEVTPIDRIKNQNIKHGTAYHNILNTCLTHQSLDFIDYQNDNTITLDNTFIYKDLVKSEIITSGINANAGGRSGNINLDGSLELNIGANTSDRQSIVLDTAGGIIGNIGRDRNNHSAVLNMDGNVLIQIGGYGISNDSRFNGLQNGYLPGVLDIRVLRPGFQATLFRIDGNSVKVMSAGRIEIHSNSDLVLKSDSSMHIEAENLFMNGRMVLKESGGSI